MKKVRWIFHLLWHTKLWVEEKEIPPQNRKVMKVPFPSSEVSRRFKGLHLLHLKINGIAAGNRLSYIERVRGKSLPALFFITVLFHRLDREDLISYDLWSELKTKLENQISLIFKKNLGTTIFIIDWILQTWQWN